MDKYYEHLKSVLGEHSHWEEIEKYYLFLVSYIAPEVAHQQISSAYLEV